MPILPSRSARIQDLLSRLSSASGSERDSAIARLTLLGARAVEPLVAALKEGEKWLRQGAAWALGKIGDPRAVGPLMTALSDPKADVRKNAAWALGQFAGDEVIAALTGAAKDPNPAVQRAAQQGLEAAKKRGEKPPEKTPEKA